MTKPPMGSIVIVTAFLVRRVVYCTPPAVDWKRTDLDEPRPGWVTGYRSLQTGKIVDDFDGRTLIETAPRTPAILVSFWPTLAPVHVPLDGWSHRVGTGDPALHFPYAVHPTLREKMRLDFAANPQPRDAKGRFTR